MLCISILKGKRNGPSSLAYARNEGRRKNSSGSFGPRATRRYRFVTSKGLTRRPHAMRSDIAPSLKRSQREPIYPSSVRSPACLAVSV